MSPLFVMMKMFFFFTFLSHGLQTEVYMEDVSCELWKASAFAHHAFDYDLWYQIYVTERSTIHHMELSVADEDK